MMTLINSYLTFNGNCLEAMNFYREILGGELTVQTIGESPLADKLPSTMQVYILHSTLSTENFVLMGSDMTPETGLVKGNAVSLMLNCNNEDDLRISFDKLSNGGEVKHPIEKNFSGTLFGGLTDKFGNNWMLHFDKNTVRNDKQLLKEISESFAYGRLDLIVKYLSEDIRWNILGEDPIVGKKAVIKAMSMDQLESLPVVTIDKIVCENEIVVIQSRGNAKTKKGNVYNQTYCDILSFKLGKIQEITTFLDASLSKENV